MTENEQKEKVKVAFITGVSGQDGSTLTEFLLNKGYHVHGGIRRCSHVPTERIEHLMKEPNFYLHYFDLTDSVNIHETLTKLEKQEGCPPDEIYNLGAMSHVKISFELPYYTAQVDGVGTLNLLNSIKNLGWTKTKFYQASTSELYGSTPPPQNEQSPFHPRSPYAVAKLFSYWTVVNYREAYGMFAVNGILFNHEGPRRGLSFVTRKVTRTVGKIIRGETDCLCLGNLNAKRDWGHAKDYVKAMWLMLQQEKPIDLVIGTGETHSIRDLVSKAFKCVNIDIVFEGEGLNEIGKDSKTGKILVKVDPNYFRPSEVEALHADPSLAKKTLNWKPEYTFDTLIEEMVAHDLNTETHKY